MKKTMITIILLTTITIFYRQSQTNILHEIYKVENGQYTIHSIFKTTPIKYKMNFSIQHERIGVQDLVHITDNRPSLKYHFGYINSSTNHGFLYAPIYFRNRQFRHRNYREGINYIVDKKLFNLVINELGFENDTVEAKALFLNYLVQPYDNSFVTKINSNYDVQQLIIKYKWNDLEDINENLEFSAFNNLYWINTFGIIELSIIKSKTDFSFHIVDHGTLGVETFTI